MKVDEQASYTEAEVQVRGGGEASTALWAAEREELLSSKKESRNQWEQMNFFSPWEKTKLQLRGEMVKKMQKSREGSLKEWPEQNQETEWLRRSFMYKAFKTEK